MRYNASLDGVRALAALLVAVYHAKMPGLPGGFLGVDVFFVLSGYLITHLLVDEQVNTGQIRYRQFMVRRLRRLYPAMVMMLLAYLVAAPLVFSSVSFQKHLRDAVWTALYVVNYSPSYGVLLSVLGHVWSLAVEVQFYLIWPLVLLIVIQLSRSMGVAFLLLLYFLATAWRWWGADHFADMWNFYVRTDTHCSGLILGGLLGYARPKLHHLWAVFGLFLLAIAVTFFSTRWIVSARYGFTIVELSAALVVVAQPVWLGNMVLSWLGRISYGFYLWHYPVMHALHDQGWSWQSVLLVGLVVGIVCGWGSYYLLERRFHRARIDIGLNQSKASAC